MLRSLLAVIVLAGGLLLSPATVQAHPICNIEQSIIQVRKSFEGVVVPLKVIEALSQALFKISKTPIFSGTTCNIGMIPLNGGVTPQGIIRLIHWGLEFKEDPSKMIAFPGGFIILYTFENNSYTLMRVKLGKYTWTLKADAFTPTSGPPPKTRVF